MNLEKYLPHLITISLAILAGLFRSSAFAFASVASLGLMVVAEVYGRLLSLRDQKQGVPEEVRRAIQDINARVATLEYGVKTRGF